MAEGDGRIPDYYVGRDVDPWRYELWAQVAGGAEGRVWRATMRLNDGDARIDVAVKVMNPDRFGGAEPWDRVAAKWEDQAAQLRNLNHPGIVGVQEAFTAGPPHRPQQDAPNEPRTAYFVMNWVHGDDLATWAAEHPRLAERLAVLENAADGLDALHSSGHVHADIKPSNLRVRTTGVDPDHPLYAGVLVDFGLMRTITGERPSIIGGSPGYWAPELHTTDGIYSVSSDLYGFAGLCVYLLTNEGPPTTGDVQVDVRERLDANGVAPAAIDALVAALHPDPARRPYASATELLSAVRTGVASSVVMTAAHSTVLRPLGGAALATDPAARSRRWKVVASAVAVAVLIGVASVLALGGDDGSAPELNAFETTTTSSSTSTTTSTLPTTTTTVASTVTSLSALAGATATTELVQNSDLKALYLDQLKPVAGDADTGQAKSNAKLFLHALSMQTQASGYQPQASVEYDLSRSWKTFTVEIGVRDDESASAEGVYAIYLDGEKKATGTLRLGTTTPITLDVTNVLRLRLEVTNTSDQYTYWVWGDAQLTK